MNLREAMRTRALPWDVDMARAWLRLPMLAVTLAVGAAAAAGGCKGNEAPHGSPVLLKVLWQVRGQQILIWSADNHDAAPFPAVPPAPTQFNLVFDRVLDGSKIEGSVKVNGVSVPVQKVGDAAVTTSIAGTSPDAGFGADSGAGTPSTTLELAVWYNSLPLKDQPPGSSYVYGRETPSYPSATSFDIILDKTLLTSQYDEPMIGPDKIPVTTQAFSLTDAVPLVVDAGVDAGADVDVDGGVAYRLPHGEQRPVNYWVPLQFNNRPADVTTVLPQYVHVTSNGAPADFQLVPDPDDVTLVYVQPPLRTTWASGARIDVTIDANLPSIYNEPLGKAGSASFIACSGPACAAADGGAPSDGPVVTPPTDAPTDVPSGASDAGIDAGVDTGIDAPID